MLEPGQGFRHIDAETGRELIVYVQADGSADINVYQDASRSSTRYSVNVPAGQLAALALMFAAHAHRVVSDA